MSLTPEQQVTELQAKLASAEAKLAEANTQLSARGAALAEITTKNRELEAKAAQLEPLTAKVTELETAAKKAGERAKVLEWGQKAGVAPGRVDSVLALAAVHGGKFDEKGEYVVPDEALAAIKRDAPGLFGAASTTTTTPPPTGAGAAGTQPPPGTTPPPPKFDLSTPQGRDAARAAAFTAGAAQKT
jgi:multidrug efflux pump subunit AcrA (membrane-fusion protein)